MELAVKRSNQHLTRSRLSRTACAALLPAWIAGAIGVALVGGADAATYKWVDEKGVTHYTDKLPPDAVNKANTELNKQGVPVKKIDAATPPEQRKAREAEAEKQKELAKQTAREQTDIARKDRALLDSYTTEADIELARNRTLKTIDQALQSAEAYSARLAKRRTELLAQKAALGTKPAPPVLERDLANTEAELGRQQEFIARKKQEQVAAAARYDADKQRWAELKASPARAEAAKADAVATGSAAAPKK